MPIINAHQVEDVNFQDIVSQFVSSSAVCSLNHLYTRSVNFHIDLYLLSTDDIYFSNSTDMLYTSRENLAETNELVSALYSDCVPSLSQLEGRIRHLNRVKNKIDNLQDSEKKDYLDQIFNLFLLDHQARLEMLNRRYARARNLFIRLADSSSGVMPYYSLKGNGWILDYINICHLLSAKSYVSDSDLIKSLDYTSLDESTKDHFSVLSPEFKRLRDLEKSQKSPEPQVRPRESEEFRNVRRKV